MIVVWTVCLGSFVQLLRLLWQTGWSGVRGGWGGDEAYYHSKLLITLSN